MVTDLVPRILTERLVQHAIQRADFEPYAAIWQQPAVVRFIGNEPCSRDVSWTTFLKYAGAWIMGGHDISLDLARSLGYAPLRTAMT